MSEPTDLTASMSTLHLDEASRAWLREAASRSGISAKDPKGWCVAVYQEPDGAKPGRHNTLMPAFPRQLVAVLEYVRQHGCGYALFHENGPIDDDLPIFPDVREP